MDSSTTDEELMLAYRDGDVRAFEELYSRHRGGLYRYLLRQCQDPHTTDELFQDVWMNLIKARERYEVKARFTTYLYRMAHNRVIDFYRKSSSQASNEFDDDPPSIEEQIAADAIALPDNVFEFKRLVERFQQALSELPAAQREAFLLREEKGLNAEQIAEITGVNTETAKSRLRYAVNKLRSMVSVEQ